MRLDLKGNAPLAPPFCTERLDHLLTLVVKHRSPGTTEQRPSIPAPRYSTSVLLICYFGTVTFLIAGSETAVRRWIVARTS